MDRHAAHGGRVRGLACAAGLALACLVPACLVQTGPARAEPPITSLQDAACRAEARARVFSVPDPLNLGLREIGRQIYFGCMRRGSRPAGRRHHRRR